MLLHSAAYAALLHRRHYVLPWFVAASVRPVPDIIFLSLRQNTERISMKFAGGNQYHEQIKWLYFKLEHEQGSRILEEIQIDVNQFCGDVKQVLTPSE